MKVLVLVILASLFVCPAYAEIAEHNYKVKKDDWTYTYRHREGTWHTEVGKKVGPIAVMYRHADLIDAKENRIKFTHNIYKSKHFKLDHRIEYRHFDTKESHWRYRFILSAKRKIADNVWLWANESYQLITKPSFQYCHLIRLNNQEQLCQRPLSKVTLADNYHEQHLPLLEAQLLKAAKRLKVVLNASL